MNFSNCSGVISFAASNFSARACATGQRSPSVNACFKNSKLENGFIVLMPSAFNCSRSSLIIKSRFEMVHAGAEKTFAVQSHPQTDRAEFGCGRQAMAGKIELCFVRHQVHVRKNRDANERLLGNLRAPPGFGPGIIAFAFLETQREQKFVQIHKKLARTAERMMVVVAPAEAKLVLAEFLDARGTVPVFPIRAFFFKKNLTGLVATHELDAFFEQMFCERNPVGVVRKKAPAGFPDFLHLEDGRQLAGLER